MLWSGEGGPDHPGKSQKGKVSLEVLVQTPLEKQLNPLAPVAFPVRSIMALSVNNITLMIKKQ